MRKEVGLGILVVLLGDSGIGSSSLGILSSRSSSSRGSRGASRAIEVQFGAVEVRFIDILRILGCCLIILLLLRMKTMEVRAQCAARKIMI